MLRSQNSHALFYCPLYGLLFAVAALMQQLSIAVKYENV